MIDAGLPPDAYYADGHDGQRLYVVPSDNLVVVRLGFSPGVSDQDLRVAALVKDLDRPDRRVRPERGTCTCRREGLPDQ